ncbi:MAG TPA: extracellular solute-binding protein [Xanthobacteraceae bacterium]|nr:extracellular solute-binding protein [Xanthobacteraceae bacterium]
MGFVRVRPIVFAVASLLVALLHMPPPASAQTASTDKIYPELAALPPAERAKRIEDGARAEGRLVMIHTMRGNLSADHVELFRKRYPFLKVELESDIGSQDASERLYSEETAARHLTDVINVALPDLTALRAKNMLARFSSPATAAILPRYQGFLDSEGRWTPWYWSEHGLSYNSSLVPTDKAPKGWHDLCNPFFKGNASYDPAEDRYLAGLYAMLGEEGAVRLIKCIGANDPIIQRGHAQRMELMLAGDHMMQGDNYLYQGVLIKRKNPSAPFAMVTSAPAFGFAGVAAINRNAPHPYAAALWTDWTLSQESQAYVAHLLRGPLTLKHPFIPDDMKIVTYVDAPADVMDHLMDAWNTYVAKRH